ncbi:MAG: sulfatase [Myxococcota bacterium]|nr:sulfatase [Myxococcota bacterium]
MEPRYQRCSLTWITCLLCCISACGDGEKRQPPHEVAHTAPDTRASKTGSKPSKQLHADAGANKERLTATDAYFGRTSFKSFKDQTQIEPLKKGSVVLLVFDALNVKHLSVYGYHRQTSPNIDAVARDGLLLRNYISNSSWTRPSFTTIITGLPKREHGVELRGGWRLEPHIKTLAERFRAAGYRTAGYTGNPLVRKAWGFDQGFQVFEDPITLGLKAFPRDRILVDKALQWLTRVKDKPFFLVMFLTASHPPYRPPLKPRQFLSELPPGEIIEHPFKEYKKPLPKLDHQRIVAAYDDEIAYMDDQVGRLIAHLKSSGKQERTIIAMTADHGEVFGDHNCYLHAYHMWEPALRVPFILNAPNLSLAGVYDDRPFTHVDIAPTLLDLVGIKYKADDLPGISIVKALADVSMHRERILFSQYNAHGVRRQAIRNGQWKLVHHHKVDKRAAKELDELHPGVAQPNPRDLPTLAWDRERYEFYNLLQDPKEKENIISKYMNNPELLGLMDALAPHIDDRKPKGQLTKEMIKALQNAGYLSTTGAPGTD